MASYQTFPKAETNELPAKKHSQASTIAVMVAALCLGAAYVSTTTGPAWAEEFFTGGGDDGYNPDDHVLCPGVKPGTNQYCDCSSDCRESNRNKYCFCAEARADSQRSTPSSRPRPHYCLRKKRRLDEASIPAALYISVVHSISIPHKHREED